MCLQINQLAIIPKKGMAILCIRITGPLFPCYAGPANNLPTMVEPGGQTISTPKGPKVDHALAVLPQKRVGRWNAEAVNGVRTRIRIACYLAPLVNK